jgi:predicted tellurium resistance membrane protein TerC
MTFTQGIGFVFLLLLWIAPALFAARIANRKGREGANYLVAAVFVSGLVALIVAVARRPLHETD